ncbi:hypothetical protein BJF85_06450 [Saccharomonospora sp. CUA-673]|uniref:type II toxin-antitoxin system VapB family antitoxin n=1 Tax=Saccharomonospora sp. CUA-673 TaxID=1904969 RepID=UPI000969AD79|nr:type II toxin-antitoxin system VapB family antitoxin [Saccharomonospora sp. CUA-673]OLT39986.1 hypothetical protein BJF85_06450 [Saccharomonospora sp. CUA-673]
MSRTELDLDDQLVAQVAQVLGTATTEETVDRAFVRYWSGGTGHSRSWGSGMSGELRRRARGRPVR